MPTYRVQVANHSATALPKDQFINTLYFTHSDIPSPTVWTTFLTALINAYKAGLPLAYTSYTLKAYDVADVKPRPIIATLSSTGTDGSPGPTQVALCLSYYSGRNLPRTRGRIYVGPFTGATLANVRPPGAILTSMLALGTAIDTAASVSAFVWCIHSVKDDDYLPISNLWVDNAWDTQRRRQTDSTTRSLATL